MISFVLGNGKSRSCLNLQNLVSRGRIYGCNALYREFTPDYLVAVDPKMIIEINQSGYQNSNEVWTNYNPQYKDFKNFKFMNPRLGWSSGPTALYLASKHCPTKIFIFGFDFVGINGKFNNIYANTENYRTSNDRATYYGNWEKQTEIVVRSNPHIQYYRVVEDNFYNTNWKYPNFKNMFYKNFFDLLPSFNKIY